MFCELFGYSKQAYYKQTRFKIQSLVKLENAKSLVLGLRRQMPRIGTRKLYYLLRDEFSQDQIKMGRDKLFDLLRNEGLLIFKRKRYTITTNSKHWMKKYPNLIKDLTIHRPILPFIGRNRYGRLISHILILLKMVIAIYIS